MALIACTNKGCMKTSNALFDEGTKEVICQECGQPIANVSEAMKRVLKSSGQVVRSNERKAFLLHCRACRANREVVLDQNNDTICKVCFGPIAITPSFKLAMEEAGSGFERVDTSEAKTATKVATKKTTKKGKVKRKKSE